MKQSFLNPISLAALAAGASLLWPAAPPAPPRPQARQASQTGAGALMVIDKVPGRNLPCPLKNTSVQADISGPLARVIVTQEFENPLDQTIEAVYVFPLPNRAAVDDMTLRIGERTIRGLIKKREEARQIYDNARQQGHTAALLDQERPNIFTQSVTNIAPRAQVKVVISYVETVKYEAGSYEFVFPMVVGPRYIPGSATGKTASGWSPDTDRVPDASRITPPVTPPGTRAGHDISLSVNLDAGVPVDSIASATHEIDLSRPSPKQAYLKLRNAREIPNKDFILRYDVAGRKIEDALLAHRGARGGFFTLLLQPPERVTPAEVTPKELVFVVDTSGSMSGFPIEKSKEVIKLALDGLYPSDTFNLITFSGDTHILFPKPVPATQENVRKAQQFLLSRQGGGGTEMMKAIRAALDPSDQQDHIRIVCFMTDGYVGNDMEIVSEVKRHPNARVFSFGIGSSVNRFLLDKMAEEGRGEVEYVGLDDDGSAAARRFHDRVRHPLLTDISIDWNGLPVSDIYPNKHPDLFAAKPLVISGRYAAGASGSIRLRGRMHGRPFERTIPVTLPGNEPKRDVLATLWARTRIEDLVGQDYAGIQNGNPRADVKAEITQLGLDFRLMTQFTSFVAVEQTTRIEGGKPVRVDVPVEMPHGVSYEGVFGASADMAAQVNLYRASGRTNALRTMEARPVPTAPPPALSTGVRKEQGQVSDQRKSKAVEPKIDPALENFLRTARITGKLSLKVWLTDDSQTTLAQLKALGLEITEHKPGKIVIAKLDVQKLNELAAHGSVLFISRDLGKP